MRLANTLQQHFEPAGVFADKPNESVLEDANSLMTLSRLREEMFNFGTLVLLSRVVFLSNPC